MHCCCSDLRMVQPHEAGGLPVGATFNLVTVTKNTLCRTCLISKFAFHEQRELHEWPQHVTFLPRLSVDQGSVVRSRGGILMFWRAPKNGWRKMRRNKNAARLRSRGVLFNETHPWTLLRRVQAALRCCVTTSDRTRRPVL